MRDDEQMLFNPIYDNQKRQLQMRVGSHSNKKINGLEISGDSFDSNSEI